MRISSEINVTRPIWDNTRSARIRPPAFPRLEQFFIPLLILLVLVVDSTGISRLDLLIRGWDGCDLGSIARNYFRNGFHALHPQIDWGGNGPGYVEMQFPLVPFLTAVLYGIFGMHEYLAAVIPIVSGIGTVLATYLFGRYLYGAATGFFAAAFVALSPWWIWQTTMLNGDPAMVMCGVFGLYFFVKWIDGGKIQYYALSIASVSMAILLKLPALYLGIPLLYLWLSTYRVSTFRKKTFWLFGILVLIPPAMWYYHSHQLFIEYGNTFGILSGGLMKFSSLDLLSSGRFYSVVGGRIIRFILTPPVALLAVIGMLRWERPGSRNVVRIWVAAVLLFQLTAGIGTFYSGQYLIPLLPPAAIIAALGMSVIIEKIGHTGYVTSLRSRVVLGILFVALLTVSYGKYLQTLQYLDPLEGKRKEIGYLVEKMTEPGSLIIVASTNGDETMFQSPKELDTPPQIFYYSDRKGWYSPMRWLNREFIRECRIQGASYLVVPMEARHFTANHPAYEYLNEHYATLVHTDDCLLYDLQKPAPN